VHANAQLKLYNRMLPGDFLHYGYFDDPDTPPETISFDAFHRAQRRYAELLLDLIEHRDAPISEAPIPDAPILDAGCGMGGMPGLLAAAGHNVTGLTPDRFQADHIRNTYPGIPVLRCRFEDIDVDKYSAYFGTIIHAESLQYMDPDGVFAVVDKIMAQSGTWIVADYFRVGNPPTRAAPADATPTTGRADRSGWRLDAFRARLREHRYTVAHEADITANVLPTLGFACLLADRIALPALDFAHDKLRAKNPALHYVLENVAERARDAAYEMGVRGVAGRAAPTAPRSVPSLPSPGKSRCRRAAAEVNGARYASLTLGRDSLARFTVDRIQQLLMPELSPCGPPGRTGAGYSTLTRRPDSPRPSPAVIQITGPEHSTTATQNSASSPERPVSRASDRIAASSRALLAIGDSGAWADRPPVPNGHRSRWPRCGVVI